MSSSSKEELDNVIEEETGGCCSGNSNPEKEDIVKVESEEVDEGGCCCVGGTAVSTSHEDEEEKESGGCCSGGDTTEHDLEVVDDGSPAVPEPVTGGGGDSTPSTQKSAPSVVEPSPSDEEVDVTLDEGIYFLYEDVGDGKSFSVFSKKGLPEASIYAKLSENSKIPAFKFRGDGRTLVSNGTKDRVKFFESIGSFFKVCKQYSAEPCIYNLDACLHPFDIYILNHGPNNTLQLKRASLGKYYSLAASLDSIVVCPEGNLEGRLKKDGTIAVPELANLLKDVQGVRTTF